MINWELHLSPEMLQWRAERIMSRVCIKLLPSEITRKFLSWYWGRIYYRKKKIKCTSR